MSLVPPTSINQLLETHERDVRPLAEIELQAALRRALASAGELSLEHKRGAWAEVAAFHFAPADGEDRAPWGSYFRPIRTAVNKEGQTVHSPNAGDIDETILKYWEWRANTTPHPLLRARYADLVWEFGQRSQAERTNLQFAWLAFDAYLDTVQQYLVEHEPQAWRFIHRAFEIAVHINDRARVARAKSALFAYTREQVRRGQLSMWWKPDEIAFGHGEIELTAGETQELLVGLENALTRSSNFDNREHYDPWQALEAADRLIRHRQRLEQPRQAMRTLRVAGGAIEKAAEVSSAKLAIGWLEELLRRYRQLGMQAEAENVEATIAKRRGEDALAAVDGAGAQSAAANSTEAAERGTGSSLEDALARLVQSFLIKEDALAAAAQSSDFGAPEGQTAHREFSARTIQAAAEMLAQNSPILLASLDRIRQRHGLDPTQLISVLGQSALFAPTRRRFLQDAAAAWLAGDWVKAIYLFVPEVDLALRDLLAGLGASVTRVRAGGRSEQVDMQEVLNSPALQSHLPRNVRLHLIALYCDSSGWNLRAKLVQGLVSYDELDQGLSNWVVHSALLVGSLKPSKGSP